MFRFQDFGNFPHVVPSDLFEETCLRLCLVQIIQGRSDAVFGVCLLKEISVIIIFFCFVIKFTKTSSFFCVFILPLKCHLNSFLATSDFRHLLTTFANSLVPDQDLNCHFLLKDISSRLVTGEVTLRKTLSAA